MDFFGRFEQKILQGRMDVLAHHEARFDGQQWHIGGWNVAPEVDDSGRQHDLLEIRVACDVRIGTRMAFEPDAAGAQQFLQGR
jgi:hypothetical protein